MKKRCHRKHATYGLKYYRLSAQNDTTGRLRNFQSVVRSHESEAQADTEDTDTSRYDLHKKKVCICKNIHLPRSA